MRDFKAACDCLRAHGVCVCVCVKRCTQHAHTHKVKGSLFMCVFVFGAILAHVLATLQCFEALQRNTRGAGDKLEESAPPLLVEGLHRLPEPLDDVAVGDAVLQPRVRLPVAKVDLPQTTDDQLQHTHTHTHTHAHAHFRLKNEASEFQMSNTLLYRREKFACRQIDNLNSKGAINKRII